MRVYWHWQLKRARKAKVGELQSSIAGNENVLWLQVTVKNAVRVTKSNSIHKLIHVALHCGKWARERRKEGKQKQWEIESTLSFFTVETGIVKSSQQFERSVKQASDHVQSECWASV
jgi:hypothetical protein